MRTEKEIVEILSHKKNFDFKVKESKWYINKEQLKKQILIALERIKRTY